MLFLSLGNIQGLLNQVFKWANIISLLWKKQNKNIYFSNRLKFSNIILKIVNGMLDQRNQNKQEHYAFVFLST